MQCISRYMLTGKQLVTLCCQFITYTYFSSVATHWAHDVVATMNQRHWRWFNVATTSCVLWVGFLQYLTKQYTWQLLITIIIQHYHIFILHWLHCFCCSQMWAFYNYYQWLLIYIGMIYLCDNRGVKHRVVVPAVIALDSGVIYRVVHVPITSGVPFFSPFRYQRYGHVLPLTFWYFTVMIWLCAWNRNRSRIEWTTWFCTTEQLSHIRFQ